MAKKTDGDSHHLTLISEVGTSVSYVGHIAEIPEIVFQAESEGQLKKEALKAVKGYFKAFPDQHDSIFKKQKVVAKPIKVTLPKRR